MRGMIIKQELLDGKNMGGLTVDSHPLHWFIYQHYFLSLAIRINGEEQFVIIMLRGDTRV